MQDRALKNSKIEFIWDSAVAEITDIAKGTVEGAVIENLKTGKKSPMKIDGVFVAIGHTPNSAPFRGQVDTDENGYILVKNGSKTNLMASSPPANRRPCLPPGHHRRGMGCMAARC